MIANSQKATVIISHNLEEKPAKVVVEAMTSQGLRFPGFGSVQADDDLNKEYGGVAFIYDHSVVELFVPTWNNYEKSKDGDLWMDMHLNKIIEGNYTNNYMIEKSVENGVKYEQDWIEEEFQDGYKFWIVFDNPQSDRKPSVSSNCTGDSLAHPMGKYPDLVVVQIEVSIGTTHKVFEGQGISSMLQPTKQGLHYGGVLYGYSQTHVRYWIACESNFPGKATLLSIMDGWGESNQNVKAKRGSMTVRLWNFPATSVHSRRDPLQVLPGLKYVLQLPSPLWEKQFMSLQIEVQNGKNRNFRFNGLGSVMNEEFPYGGVVYGYNDSVAAIWVPETFDGNASNSAVFLVGGVWGDGYQDQRTNQVDILISVMSVYVPVCILNHSLGLQITVTKKYARSNETMFTYGDEIFLQCVSGYRQRTGNQSLLCTEAGTWNASVLECEEQCLCPCNLTGTGPSLKETDKLQKRIKQLKEELAIIKATTSKARRMRISVNDSRPSARAVGMILGAGILATFFGFIILSDLMMKSS
ncbi:uncharacterized protein LOC125664905 [Ostrea edulis]|uniref:uncharacterized protein LOC125664905 n=1 Tax=Ostrea edulis TaxID=37623 RepID=UPI0024AEAFC3|nr:uncharacterized protein LOC125664905 [Ostrea edulis]